MWNWFKDKEADESEETIKDLQCVIDDLMDELVRPLTSSEKIELARINIETALNSDISRYVSKKELKDFITKNLKVIDTLTDEVITNG